MTPALCHAFFVVATSNTVVVGVNVALALHALHSIGVIVLVTSPFAADTLLVGLIVAEHVALPILWLKTFSFRRRLVTHVLVGIITKTIALGVGRRGTILLGVVTTTNNTLSTNVHTRTRTTSCIRRKPHAYSTWSTVNTHQGCSSLN